MGLTLGAWTSSGRAGCSGNAIGQTIGHVTGPVGHYPKVLKGVLFLGPRCWRSCSWHFVLVPSAVGRYAADTCFYWLGVTGYGVGCFKGVAGRGSVHSVGIYFYTSETGGYSGRPSCAERSESE
jgi:hypothetical protein